MHLILFADDTNIFYANDDIVTLISTLNQQLSLINEWFLANKLSLNVSKTNFIIFCPRQRKYSLNNYSKVIFNGTAINQVKCTKFLGISIDEHLCWNHHIHQVESKLSKCCGILAKLKYLLPQRVLLTIYNSLILPYLNYCPIIWAGCNSENKLKKILTLQKKAVRSITKSSFTAHASPLFKKLNLLKISDLCRFQSAVFMHKFSTNQLPSSFNRYFTSNSGIHTYNTRQASNYHLFSVNTSVRKTSIAASGPKLWNALPDNIKKASSLALFKRKLKLHLLTN